MYWPKVIDCFETSEFLNELELSYNQEQKNTSKKTQKKLEPINQIIISKKNLNLHDTFNYKSSLAIKQLEKVLYHTKDECFKFWIHSQLDKIYYYYEEAIEHFLSSSKTIDNKKIEDFIPGEEALKQQTSSFFTIKDYQRSISYLNLALKTTSKRFENYSPFLNTIGNYYFELNDLLKVKKYQNGAILAVKKNDFPFKYSKILGNLAYVAILQKDYIKAEHLFLVTIKQSKQLCEHTKTIFAQLLLGKGYLLINDIEKAKIYFLKAQKYASSKKQLFSYNHKLSQQLLKLVFLQKDIGKESTKVINSINWKIQKEKVTWKLEAEKIKLQNHKIIKQTFVVTCVLLLILILLIIVVVKKKILLQQYQLENIILTHKLKKIESEKDLNNSNNTLKSFKTYLNNKNEQINQLEKEYLNIKERNYSLKNQQKESLESLLNSHLMTQDKWIIFKESFIKEQPDFYKTLVKKFPDLTDSNLRIILLQHLGLSNLEVSKLLGITVDAVKKAKQRLRQKYKNNIDLFIQQKTS